MKEYLHKKWWAIAIAILFVANIATLGMFWYNREKEPPAPPPPPGVPRGNPPALLMRELKFTTEQEEQYNQLFRDHQQQVRRIKDSIRFAKDNLFSLLSNDSVSTEELDRRASQAAQAEKRLDVITFQHFEKVKSICNDEQKKNFDKIIKMVVRRMAPPPPPPPPPPGEDYNGDGNERKQPPHDDMP